MFCLSYYECKGTKVAFRLISCEKLSDNKNIFNHKILVLSKKNILIMISQRKNILFIVTDKSKERHFWEFQILSVNCEIIE